MLFQVLGQILGQILKSPKKRFLLGMQEPYNQNFNLSGYRDSNPGPPTPEAGALTGLRYTPYRFGCRLKSLVGVPGFEPGTPCSQSRCANRTALHPVLQFIVFISDCGAKVRLYFKLQNFSVTFFMKNIIFLLSG